MEPILRGARRPAGIPSLAVAVVATLIAGLLGLAGPTPPAVAQGGPISWVLQPGVLDTTTGPAGAEIPVTLDYDLYIPETASAATPQPAIVLGHGFGGAKDNNELRTLGAFFASNGYVVLASSHMGFGGSSGCIALDLAAYDGVNVSRLIDVLAARPDVMTDASGDPVVGMAGGSYGGGHQGGVAALDDRMDAIAPARTWHSLQYSLVPNNLVTTAPWAIDATDQGVFKQVWTSLFFALGSTQPLMGGGGCDPLTQQTLYPGQPPCPGFDPRVCGIFGGLTSTGDATQAQIDFIEGGAMRAFMDGIDIPTFLLQGQSDTLFTLTEAIATFEGLDPRDVPIEMVFNSGGHGYPPLPGEGEPYAGTFDETDASQDAFARTYLAGRLLDFFDGHLRGQPHDPPAVSYFRDWVPYDVAQTGGTAAPAYADATAFPVAGVLPLVLDAAAGALLPAGSAVEPSSATLIAPPDGRPAAHSETPNFTGPGQPGEQIPPSEVEGQHIALDSAPMDADTELVGAGRVLLDVANINAQDPILFTKLYDVAPDGTATLIRRLVAASRIDADLLPGRVLLRLPSVVHRVDAGHRIRLVVSTTDDSYRNQTIPDVITLTTDGAAVVELPAVTSPPVERLSGPDRLATAVRVSQEAFDAAPTLVIAAAGDFPDALAATGLAATVDGPLLLAGDGVSSIVLDELDRLGAGEVLIVGGTASLSGQVEAELVAHDPSLSITRIAGADRIATAAAVADEMVRRAGPVDRVVLARADAFADALSAGSLAARGAPILLTQTDALATVTADALARLAPTTVYVAGGTAAVSDDVASAVEAATGRGVTRLAGGDRFATSDAVVAEARRLDPSATTAMVASGTDFPDALAAGAAGAALDGVVVLIDPAATRAEQAVRGSARAFVVGGYAALDRAAVGRVALGLAQDR